MICLTVNHERAYAQCSIPNFEAAAVGDTESCDPIDFGYKLTGYLDNPATTKYLIDFGDGNTLELAQTDLDASGETVINHTYEKVTCELNTGENFYTVVIEASRTDCEVVAPRTVRISPVIIGKAPEPAFDFDPNPGCVNANITFINNTTPGFNFDCSTNSTYIWDFGDGSPVVTTDEIENVNHTYTVAGTYDVTLTVLHDCGDRVTMESILISEIPTPKFEITETLANGSLNTLLVDTTCTNPAMTFELLENLCTPVTLDLKNLSEGDSLTYIWEVDPAEGLTFANGEVTSEDPNEQITFTEAGSYLISLKAENSCGFETSCVRVNVVDVPSPDNVEILGLENLCGPADLDFSVNIPTGTDYAWTIVGINGTPNPGALGGANTADPNPINLAVGTYQIDVTITNACGTGSASEIIEIVTPPEVTLIAPNLSICQGEAVRLEASSSEDVTYQWYFNGDTIPDETNDFYEALLPGEYRVSANRGGRCLVFSEPVTLEEKVKPEATITSAGPDAYCEGQPVATLLQANTGEGLTYRWFLDGVEIVGATAATLTANQIGSYELEVTLEGCTELSTPFVISSLPLPTVGVTAFRPDICVGESVPLEATGALAYEWAPAESLDQVNGNIVQASPTVTTTYTVRGVNANGCVSTNTITIVVNPPPVLTFTVSEQDICAGQTTTITASGGEFYTWEEHPSLSATEGNVVTANPLETTTYRVTGTDVNGCVVLDSVTISVKPLPDVDIEDEEVCVYNEPFTLQANPQVAGTGTWSAPELPAGALTPEGLFDPNIAGVNIEGHVIQYLFEESASGSNCVNVFTKRVFVYPRPEPFFEVDSLVCVDTEINFASLTEVREWETLTFEWKFPDGSVVVGDSATYTFTETTPSVSVTLLATSQTGCVDSITQEFGIVAPPAPAFEKTFAPLDSCAPLVVDFQNTSIGEGLTYEWDFGNGVTSNVENPESQVYMASAFNDTTYYIRLSVANACQSAEFMDSVKVKAAPVANFVFELDTVCSNYPLKLFNFSIGSPNNFIWDYGDGSAPFVTQDTGFVQHNFIYEGTTDTTYNITLIAESDCGLDTLTRPLVVIPNTVTSFFNVNTDNGCAPLTVNFNSNQDGRNAIIWLWGEDETAFETGGLNRTHTYEEPGVYLAQMVAISGCNIDTFSREITVFPGPDASFAAPAEVCLGQTVDIVNTSANPYLTRWEFGDGTTFNGVNPPPKLYDAEGQYTISMFVTEPTSGCVQELQQTITVRAFPTVAFEVLTDPVCQSEPIQIANLSSGAQSYYWDFGTKSAPSLETEPVAFIEESGVVDVTLVAFTGPNLTGCSDTLVQTINVLPQPLPDFVFSTEVVCGIMTATFENLTTFPADPSEGELLWIFGNGNTYNGFDDIPPQAFQNLTESGQVDYTITLRATTNAGCVQEHTETLTFEACCQPKLIVPEDGKSFAFTPFNGGQNDEFRIKTENVETFDMKIFNKWGQMVFHTEDLEEGWDGYFEGQKCETGLYQVKVEYSGCRFGEELAAEPKVVQLYLLD